MNETNLIATVTFCLKKSSDRLRSQICDLLAAICVLSLSDGHSKVLAAFSDYQVRFREHARFESLVQFLAQSPDHDPVHREDLASLWDSRAAVLALINALVSSPADIDQRASIREEFRRRGLDDALLPIRQAGSACPDQVVRQMQLYAEEKEDDDEARRTKYGGAVASSVI